MTTAAEAQDRASPALKYWVQGRAARAFDPVLYRQRHAAERGINQLTGPLP